VRLFGRRGRPAAPAGPAGPSLPAERCLFIMGAPRTGTTVLQNALNHSPEIFLLGEPGLYNDTGPGFRARYNDMQRGWRNQETKSTYLPAFTRDDGTWRDHLAAASGLHRWVGAKLVINPVRAEGDLQRRFDVHTRDFYRSRYIFTFRPPLDAALSTHDLQVLVGGGSDGIRLILRNFLEVLGLYVRAFRILPHVRAVFHDAVDAGTFTDLGAWLQVALPDALTYYEAKRVRAYAPSRIDALPQDMLAAISQLYIDLKAAAVAGHDRPQLEQNDRHLSPDHYLPLGSLDRRARLLCAALV
jgi:hypothetical protein